MHKNEHIRINNLNILLKLFICKVPLKASILFSFHSIDIISIATANIINEV